MLEVFLDALKDSAIIFGFVFVLYIVLSFFEGKLARVMEHSHKWSPIAGVSFGLIPQCGFSVVAADLFNKKHITIGTVIGVFIATSDEALPIFLGNVEDPSKIIMILPLLGIKFCVGLGVAYLVDFIFRDRIHETHDHEDDCHCEETHHIGCCGHDIEGEEDHEHSHLHQNLIHPLLHSLKILAYVFVINFLFGTLLYFVGEDKVVGFLELNKYLAPLFSVLVGFIPNCASSVILAELYLLGGIPFGACVGGLCVNAGLGLFVLYKNVKNVKDNLTVTAVLCATGLLVGYLVCIFEWFVF